MPSIPWVTCATVVIAEKGRPAHDAICNVNHLSPLPSLPTPAGEVAGLAMEKWSSMVALGAQRWVVNRETVVHAGEAWSPATRWERPYLNRFGRKLKQARKEGAELRGVVAVFLFLLG